MNITGNLSDQQVTDALLKQDMLGQFAKNSKAGGGRGSDALRGFVMQAQPHLGQDPKAIVAVTQVLRDANALPMKINDLYNGKEVDGLPGLTPGERVQLRSGASVAQWADQKKAELMEAAVKRARAGTSFGQQSSDAPAPAPQAPRRSLSDILFGGGSPAPATSTPAPTGRPFDLVAHNAALGLAPDGVTPLEPGR